MTQHEALRRAAILITALDAPTADQLLDHLPEAQASLVRQAVFDLDWIDPAEQEEVLAAFMAGTKQNQVDIEPAAATGSSDVELVLSSDTPPSTGAIAPTPVPAQVTAHVESYPIPYPPRKPAAPRPGRFEFLHHQPASTVARLLEQEHPQTIAVVAAHLPIDQSTELLEALPSDLNAEVMRRVADLDQIDHETISDMEQELRRSYESIAKLASSEPPLPQPLDDEPLPASQWHGEDDSFVDRSRDLASEVEAYRQLARSVPEVTTSQPDHEQDESQIAPIEHDTTATASAVDWTFDDVTELSDGDLASVLQQAGSELTMMALAGSDPTFVARLSSQLSPAMARQFSQRMEEIGPLSLRDIESAQQRIAEYAEELAAGGIIEQKESQPFAAAA